MWTAPPMGTGHLIRLGEKDCVLRKGASFLFLNLNHQSLSLNLVSKF